ncbi:hypothetical protein, conserved [Leishmania lindenbergi]|uniref:Flagellar attachment zone protein 1 conserved domain-containing protein n=1 Tax=Leishmania lindenbergi TaxID=651832 RepID=A0AAW3AF14_9TRYP
MEEDNQRLVKLYEEHTSDIAALRVLAQERKYKDAVFTAMEAKTASMDAFLKELMSFTCTGRSLRVRKDANSTQSTAAKPSTARTPPTVVSMDEVRDAVQKQQHALEVAQKNGEEQRLVIQALENEVASLKQKGRSPSTRLQAQKRCLTKPDNATADEDCCLPGTAKELRDAQRRIRELERQLTSTRCEAKNAAAAVASLQQQCTVHLQALKCRDDELAAMRNVLDSKEQLISTLESEVRKQRSTSDVLQIEQERTSQHDDHCGRPNSAPAVARHRCGGDEASSGRLVVTHHYHLFGGQAFVDSHSFSPESFKDAFLRSVSTLLKVPYGYLRSVEVRTHSEAVSVEFDVRHSARIREDEINFSLLSHGYPELTTFLDKTKAELATRKPLDCNAVRVKELEATLAERVAEVDNLRRAMRSLEASLHRRDADREVLDTDMDAALCETELTVKEVYEALQAMQQEAQDLQKALAVKTSQLRVLERAKAVALDAATAAEEQLKTDRATLHEQLATAQAAVEQAREAAMQEALQRHTNEKVELLMNTFHFDMALPTASAQRTVSHLLKEAQRTRVLQALLLCHAARTAGAVPVVAKKCSLGDDAATLKVAVELAFYASKKDADAVKTDITKKLSEDSCSAVYEYVRMLSDASKREAETVADAQRAVSEAEQRATAAIAAMQAETQQTQNTQRAATSKQLREIHARVSSILPGGSADVKSILERIDQLALRLATAESTAHRLEEDSHRAAQRFMDAQQEREQLQQTLSNLTGHCTKLRIAKEQLTARVAAAESQLRNQQVSAAESESALVEKVRHLEASLRAKADATDSERDRLLEEHRTAATLAAARLAEVEEALAIKETALAQLQSKTASSGSGAASSGSVEETALREALRLAKQERTALARQVREMDMDMNDLSNIQAAMQRELEVTQQELRAKKHDFDLLVKQLIRMEEKEKKWTSDHPASPVSPKKQDEDTELDDVARESLIVLTNSNIILQQCLRRLQCTMAAMGMAASLSSSSATDGTDAVAGTAAGRGGERDGVRIGDDSSGTRRSGHRKSALGATVSRTAMNHQKLSAQLADMLLRVLQELETSMSSGTASRSCGRRGPATATAAVADAATTNLRVATQRRSAKHSPMSIHFSRTASTPAAIGTEKCGQTFNGSFTSLRDAAIASHNNTPKRGTVCDAALSTVVTGSGGKAIIMDAAPRLDFHRQGSSRTYTRSNTATSVPVNAGSAELLPVAAASDSASPDANSDSSGAATRGSGGERKGEKGKEELPRGVSGRGGAATAGGALNNASPTKAPPTIRRNEAPTATTKANPLRRTNATATTSGGSAIGTSFVRTGCGYRRLPMVTDSNAPTASLAKRTRPPQV